MKRRELLLVCSLLAPMLAFSSTDAGIFDKFKKKKATTTASTPEKKISDYEKLFKDKKCETKKGLITLHKVDDSKLYFELPFSLLGREMLLGSTISETSNNAHGVIGYKPKDPLHVTFRKIGPNFHLCLINCLYGADETVPDHEGIAAAVKKSTIDGIYRTFKPEAYNPDSTAVVIDVTNLFLEDNKDLTPFDPWGLYSGSNVQRNTSFEKSKSHLGEIKSFSDNVVVKSYLSYTVDVMVTSGKMTAALEYKRPFTALMTRSLILLPEEQMRPRIADSRMNIFVAPKAKFSSNKNRGTLPVYYARHWRVEPSDMEAWKRGEMVEPKKHIDFYIDKNFPETWKPAIRAGILDWNAAFEEIGFKNVIRALDFPDPEEDPEFDPDNIKYSCLRYEPISIMNAMGPSWDDPRTGEIINASVVVYHDITRLVNNWRLIQTAVADPAVRTKNIPDNIMDDAMRYVIAHEIGHCLGYMHNFGSSAAFPNDSLRSPSFTQKYGTTPCIMDYARFNYIAQEGDAARGVNMNPPHLGIHDKFAIKWLYSPIPDAKTPEEEVATLDKWIFEKADNPMFRYGKQQPYNILDPSAQSEDLGDDVISSAEVGIKNLKYVMNHLSEWVDKEDPDYSYRQEMYTAILNQYMRYILHVYNVKGGVYMNERKAGDPRPAYEFVDGDYQRRAQKFLGDQLHDLDWLDQNPLVKELPLQGNLSNRIQRILVSLISAARGSLESMKNPAPNAYTVKENADMAFDAIFAPTLKGENLNDRDRTNQVNYLDFMFMVSGLEKSNTTIRGFADEKAPLDQENFVEIPSIGMPDQSGSMCCMSQMLANENLIDKLDPQEGDVNGFGYFRSLYASFTPFDHIYYQNVLQARNLIYRMRNTGDKETRAHYELLLHRIDGLLQ